MNLPGSVMNEMDDGELIDFDFDGGDDDVSDQTRRVALAHEYIREVGLEAMLEALRELGELPDGGSDLMVYD